MTNDAQAYATAAVEVFQAPTSERELIAWEQSPLAGHPALPIPEGLCNSIALTEVLERVAPVLNTLEDEGQAARLAFLCGIWIESGGEASAISGAITERCARSWRLICEMLDDVSRVDDIDACLKTHPQAARAWILSKYLHLAAMAALTRDLDGRIKARKRGALMADLERVWEALPNGYYVKEVLRGVDRLRCVVLHPFEGVGCVFEAHAVRNTWHLLTLIQGLFAGPEAPLSDIPGDVPKPTPNMLSYAQAEHWNRESDWDHACFGHHTADAWMGDGFHPDADAVAPVYGPGSPLEIPQRDGHTVILLSALHQPRRWSANWLTGLHQAFIPELSGVTWLDRDDIAAWLAKISAAD